MSASLPAVRRGPAEPAAQLSDLTPMPYRARSFSRIRNLLRLPFLPILQARDRILADIAARRADRLERAAGPQRILARAPGHMPANGRAICLYAHFSPAGRVSRMVLRQLETYTLLGFDVVFTTASNSVPAEDWAAVQDRCTLALRRRNYGLDFGTWADAAEVLGDRLAGAEELLLANDSVLGPIRPLEPVFAALRAGGDGLFGLTESVQHAVHLQSYLLLARGPAAVAELAAFLRQVPLSAAKSRVIAGGELALSRHMAARGHRVAALYGYEALERAVLADAAETRRLVGSIRPFRRLATLPPEDRPAHLRRMLLDVPLNPTHHYWAPLVRLLGFPFIKTELVAKNPARVPDAPDWAMLVPPDAPCPSAEIADHLRLMREGQDLG